MPDDAKEVHKQFVTYADAITAFATAQTVGFVLLLARGDCFAKNVIWGLPYTVPAGIIAGCGYLILVHLCHRAANQASEVIVKLNKATHENGKDKHEVHKGIQKDLPAVDPILLQRVWTLRYIIVLVGLIATVLVPLGVRFGIDHRQFFLDCKCG